MIIEKNGKAYTVRETATTWTLTLNQGKVQMMLSVSKDDCKTFEALESFVKGDKSF